MPKKKRKPKPSILGSGMAAKAGRALSGRGKTLKKAECKSEGMGYNQSTGKCKR